MSETNYKVLGEVVADIWFRKMRGVYTVVPAKVISYNKDKQTAQCQITIQALKRQEDQTLTAVDLPPINNVPVIFPSGGGYRILFPVKPDDTLALLFSAMSLDEWSKGDGLTVVDPKTQDIDHRFRLQDAIMLPGLHPVAKAWTGAADDHMVIGKDGGAVQLHIFGDKIGLTGAAPGDALALASKVASALTALKTAIAGAAVAPSDGGAVFKANLITALADWPPGIGSAKVLSD